MDKSFRAYKKDLERKKEEQRTLNSLENMVREFGRRKETYTKQAKEALKKGDQNGYAMAAALLKNVMFQQAQAQDMLTNFTIARDLREMGSLNVQFTKAMDKAMKEVSRTGREADFGKSKKIFQKGMFDRNSAAQQLKDLLESNGMAFTQSVQSLSDIRDEDIRATLEGELKRESGELDRQLRELEEQFSVPTDSVKTPSVSQPTAEAKPVEKQVVGDLPAREESDFQVPMYETNDDFGQGEGGDEGKDEEEKEPSMFDYTGDKYVFPPMELLTDCDDDEETRQINEADAQESIALLEKKLRELGVGATAVGYTVGACFSRIEMQPDSDVTLSDVLAVEKDLSLALGRSARIVYPLEGKNLLGVEIENKRRETLRLKEFLEKAPDVGGRVASTYETEAETAPKNAGTTDGVAVGLGFDLERNARFAALETLPHLLVGGATGSGKSCFLNALLTGFLYRYTPEELRLVLVDFKRVEFSVYRELPHVVGGKIVREYDEALEMLEALCEEMERRYKLCEESDVNSVAEYNATKKKKDRFPSIVVVIDEYADIMVSNQAKRFENLILRLAQKARASGIHLIVSTQRPSVKVISGLIKANFPSRISFKVSSHIDSRNILDQTGAHKLLGKGDFIYCSAAGTSRLQAPYISSDELRAVTAYIREHNAEI